MSVRPGLPTLQAALQLAREGLPVFPCRRNEARSSGKLLKAKSPFTLHGFKDATTDPELIGKLWFRLHDRNVLIGVPTGAVTGILTLDVDPEGIPWREQNKDRLGVTRTHRTQRPGAMHLLYRYPKDITISCSTGKLALGVDVRGEGGYIIWWPAHGLEWNEHQGLAELPEWPLHELLALEKSPRRTRGARAHLRLVDGPDRSAVPEDQLIPEGQRNDFLSARAYARHRSGMSLEQNIAATHAENTSALRAPLDADEVETIVRNKQRLPTDADERIPDAELEQIAASLPTDVEARPDEVCEPSEQQHTSDPAIQRIAELAKLSPIEYDRVRVAEAEKLGIRVSTLDAEVTARHPVANSNTGLAFPDPEPWPEAVDGEALLKELCDTIHRYVVLPEAAAVAGALWVLHSWTHDASYISPYLLIRSPQRRCGKTTLLTILGTFARRPLTASSASAASIFRIIEKYRPALVLDEVDAWMRENEELRAILNGGHTRTTAYVLRTVGDEHEPQRFSTFCPKLFAGIGKLAETLEDRAVVLTLKRKLSTEQKEKLRIERFDRAAVTTQRQCRRWGEDHLGKLRSLDPQLPPTLNDRAADNWRPLFAIAALAGGDWLHHTREAALALSGRTDDQAAGEQLLADIRRIFVALKTDRVRSRELADALGGMADRPWAGWGKQEKKITALQVARLLDAFDVDPHTVAFGKERDKGYKLDQFEDVFPRYLPGACPAVTWLLDSKFSQESPVPSGYPKRCENCSEAVTTACGAWLPAADGGWLPNEKVIGSGRVTDQNVPKQSENQSGNRVTTESAQNGGGEEGTPARNNQVPF